MPLPLAVCAPLCVPLCACLQEKRSAYAPTLETPVRYDGIYRIVRCWRTKGAQVGGGAGQAGGRGVHVQR